MLRFLNGYLPEVWDAQIKAGLVRDVDGIRLCQSNTIEKHMQFNGIAKKGGELYNILSERRCPFYIDRLQGGLCIDEYPYDTALLNDYKEMLGDNFWGFQMHEWLSNYASDICKLSDLPDERWNEKEITDYIFKKYPIPNLFLESMTAAEIAEFGRPRNFEDFYRNMTSIYKKRQRIGDLIPVDSSMLMYAFEIAAGSTRIMPEVGAQTSDARVQICYARGMTRKEGLHFGVYYEPWARTPQSKNSDMNVKPPITACCYQKDEKNEWNIGGSADFPFQTNGINGGGSRSLQKRIFLYSYLSGAEFMSEEWGVCNLFYDWRSFELSPYGQVKKDFVDFMTKYPDVGEKLTPIAAVLPKDLPLIDNVYKKPLYKPVFPIDHPHHEKVKEGVIKLFADSAPMEGTETITLSNNEIPDALDMLNDGFGDLGKYDFLVDLTFDPEFAKKHRNICDINDVKAILRKTLPCFVEGDLHWLVNRRENGGFYLTVFNHSGVCRTLDEGEFTLSSADKTVEITFKGDASPVVCEGAGVLKKMENTYTLTVPAGDFAFIKF